MKVNIFAQIRLTPVFVLPYGQDFRKTGADIVSQAYHAEHRLNPRIARFGIAAAVNHLYREFQIAGIRENKAVVGFNNFQDAGDQVIAVN